MSTTKTDSQIAVQSIMQRSPVKIFETETIHDAVDKMAEHHVSALPVVDEGGVLLGILSVNDLLRVVQGIDQKLEDRLPLYEDSFWLTELIRDQLGTNEVTSVMTGSPVTVGQDESLQQVARLMINHQVHHIPVVSKDNRLLGMVSSIDFVRLASDGI